MPEHDSITELDLADLARAKKLLENPGFIAKAADAVGTPINKVLHALPEKAWAAIQTATRTALEKALKVAVATLGGKCGHEPSNIGHKVAALATGAAGGAFGIMLPGASKIVGAGFEKLANAVSGKVDGMSRAAGAPVVLTATQLFPTGL